MQTNIAHHHARKRRHKTQKKEPAIDKIILAAAIAAPLSNIPQLITVWTAESVTGVSVVSWACFAIISALWLVYGRVHKEAPIQIMNGALLCMQALIIFAVVTK